MSWLCHAQSRQQMYKEDKGKATKKIPEKSGLAQNRAVRQNSRIRQYRMEYTNIKGIKEIEKRLCTAVDL